MFTTFHTILLINNTTINFRWFACIILYGIVFVCLSLSRHLHKSHFSMKTMAFFAVVVAVVVAAEYFQIGNLFFLLFSWIICQFINYVIRNVKMSIEFNIIKPFHDSFWIEMVIWSVFHITSNKKKMPHSTMARKEQNFSKSAECFEASRDQWAQACNLIWSF